MKILIADDDSVSRRLLQSYLQKWGYEVTTAQDGADAWRQFEDGQFPMVITDWMMPEVDGPELIRRVRSAHRAGYVYAMLLTAKTEKADLVEGMEAGADDFLTKPFDRGELRVRLRAGERIIRLESNLRATQATLLQTEQLASLGRLAAGVAHEINNPISYVINNLFLIRRDYEATLGLLDRFEQGREILARERPELVAELARLEEEADLTYARGNLARLFRGSQDGLQRIRDIVQNLRTFARLDEATHKELDLNEVLKSTLEALKHELSTRRFQVQTDFQELSPLACHPGKIGQMFFNLLLNAIQASEPGGLIEVRSRPDGEDWVLVEIEDHGCGIPPEHLSHIFEPFYTTKPVGSGTGLGLSVSHGIVRGHGGSLEVETAVGQGSRFRVRLPLRAPDVRISGPASA